MSEGASRLCRSHRQYALQQTCPWGHGGCRLGVCLNLQIQIISQIFRYPLEDQVSDNSGLIEEGSEKEGPETSKARVVEG